MGFSAKEHEMLKVYVFDIALYDFSKGKPLSDERFYTQEEAEQALETELDNASKLWKEWGYNSLSIGNPPGCVIRY